MLSLQDCGKLRNGRAKRMDDVGQTIRRICKRADITYKQLSQILHVSPDAVSDWANGINTPKRQNAEQIPQSYGSGWDYLTLK